MQLYNMLRLYVPNLRVTATVSIKSLMVYNIFQYKA